MIMTLLAAATVTLTIPKPPEVDVERMLDAIAACENWDNKTAGAAGEWGIFQMTPASWTHARGSLRKTIQQATPSEMRTAAREELLFRMATARINHVEPTPFICGLLWTAGVSATLKHTASQAKRAYATRCENLYSESLKH